MFKVIKTNTVSTKLKYCNCICDCDCESSQKINKLSLDIKDGGNKNIISVNFSKKYNIISDNNGCINYMKIGNSLNLSSIKPIKSTNKDQYLGIINDNNFENKLFKFNINNGEYKFYTVNGDNDFFKLIYRTIRDNYNFGENSLKMSHVRLVTFFTFYEKLFFFVQYHHKRQNLLFIISTTINYTTYELNNCFKLNSFYDLYRTGKINNFSDERSKNLLLEEFAIKGDDILLLMQYSKKSHIFSLKYFRDLDYFGSNLEINNIVDDTEQKCCKNYIRGEFKGIDYIDCENVQLVGLDIDNEVPNSKVTLIYKKLKK